MRGRKKREGRVRGWEAHPGDSGLRRLAEVAVVQAADFRKLYDPARCRELDGSEVGRVFFEREVRARLMVIDEVADQDAAQVPLAEDEDVIQAVPSRKSSGAMNLHSAD